MPSERDRIRAEYERRAAEIPDARYEPTAPENLFTAHELERVAAAALGRAGLLPLAGRRVLDAGCGAGGHLALFESWGARRADLAGIDLMPDRAAAAATRLPGADVRTGDASALPWEDGRFDIVFHSMMLSSVLDPAMRRAVAAEMGRVLRPGGVVLWYDFFVSHPRNPHVRGVGRRELRRLFPGFEARLRRVTLAPPLARRIVPRARTLAAALAAARMLDTHYLGTLRKP